jgi:hypothetical protein
MSNRRVKSLAADEDDGYDDDYEDQYEDEDAGVEMTDEDHEQMRIGTAKVRKILGPAFSSLAAKDIEEALWHYYYDVDKSVNYLKSMRDAPGRWYELTSIDKHRPRASMPEKAPVEKKGKHTFLLYCPTMSSIWYQHITTQSYVRLDSVLIG